jgi:hypothetical protein
MPFPCRCSKGLDCVSPIWFTQCGCVWLTHAMQRPCRLHAVLIATSQGQGTTRHGRDMGTACYVWINIGLPEMVCGRPAHVRLLTATTPSSTKVVTVNTVAVPAVRIFPSTTRTFTKDTALSENGRNAAWHVWIDAAGERHGNGVVCVN